ncbi:MAG: response regulator [Lachnospiraceae bacterium]
MTVFSGYEKAQNENFDVILSDVMLPGLEGFQLVRKLREKKIATPVLFWRRGWSFRGRYVAFASMNLQIAWLNSGTDAKLEWQWDGGHVPSEIFGESLALYIDEMYGKYMEGAAEITKAAPEKQTVNGDAEEASGQETYEFGNITQDARHFDKYVLKVLEEKAETLSELFNQAS